MSEETVPDSTPQQQQEIFNPLVPATVEQLSALQGQQGVEIVKKRIDILQAARAGSIRLTHPRDWVLFRADSGIYAYLQDSGCERLIDVWGIEVMNVSDFTREDLEDGSFIYTLFGDGYCKLTRQRVEKLIGARDSTSMEMGQDIHPAKLKVETMKAARSNLDGGMVRHLAGLANVPLEEINKIFGRKPDDLTSFNLGKGFGGKAQRHGADPNEYGPPPPCPKCKKTMRFVAGKDGRDPFWGCVDYQTCGQKPITAKKVQKKSEEKPSETDNESHEETIWAFKNKLLKTLKGHSQEKDLKPKVMNAQTIDELMDIEIELKEKP